MSRYFGSNDENKKIELNRKVINNTQIQKLLGVHIDYKLKSDTHNETLLSPTLLQRGSISDFRKTSPQFQFISTRASPENSCTNTQL